MKTTAPLLALTCLLLTACGQMKPVTFAVLGDFGTHQNSGSSNEKETAVLLNQSLCPDFIITVGDNNYLDTTTSNYGRTVGDYYADYGPPAHGTEYAPRDCPTTLSGMNFYPTPGNHDFGDNTDSTNIAAYMQYFPHADNGDALTSCASVEAAIQQTYPSFRCPASGSYQNLFYDFQRGPVHFFGLNTFCPSMGDADDGCYDTPLNCTEVLGATPTNTDPCAVQYCTQTAWMGHVAQNASKAAWKVAFFHHPPYSSGRHTSCQGLQFDYQAMGLDIVLTGHDHSYNRVVVASTDVSQPEFVYLTNGLGGVSVDSAKCYNDLSQENANVTQDVLYAHYHGATFAEATAQALTFTFYNKNKTLKDVVALTRNRQGTITTAFCPDGNCDTDSFCDCAAPNASGTCPALPSN